MHEDPAAGKLMHGSEPAATGTWKSTLLGMLWAAVLVALSKTWRVRMEGVDTLDEYLAENRPLAAVFWHGQYLMLFPLLRGRDVCVFTSLSRRGKVLHAVARALGMTAMMIPDRGGENSYNMMKDSLADKRAGAIAVDGPLGPYHHVKAGAIRLSSDLGLDLFPAAAVGRKTFCVRRRWDRLEIPLPFARVGLVVGGPFTVSPNLSQEQLEHWFARVHEHLDAASAKAADLLRSP